MKNKRLNLNELKVESFVTSLENENEQTVKGGGTVNGWTGASCMVLTLPSVLDRCPEPVPTILLPTKTHC